MDVQEVIDYFGGIRQTAEALNKDGATCTYQAIQQWRQKGEIPPMRRWQIELVTNGKFRADSD